MSATLLGYTIVGTFFSFILIILFSLMDGLDVPAIIQRAWVIPLGGMLVGSCQHKQLLLEAIVQGFIAGILFTIWMIRLEKKAGK